MRFKEFIIHQEGLALLTKSGLAEKLDHYKKQQGIYRGALFFSETFDFLRGQIPEWYDKAFAAFIDQTKFIEKGKAKETLTFTKLQRQGTVQLTIEQFANHETAFKKETLNANRQQEYLLMHTPYFIGEAITPKDLEQYKAYGFRSVEELCAIGTLYLQQEAMQGALVWETGQQHQHRHTYEPDNDSRLVIRKADITEYPTKDPWQTMVRYQPIKESQQSIIGGQYTELLFLNALLSYMQQEGIDQELNKETYRAYIKKKRPQTSKARSVDTSLIQNLAFAKAYHLPTQLDHHSFESVRTMGGDSKYSAYIQDHNLVFYFLPVQAIDATKGIGAFTIEPNEAFSYVDNLITHANRFGRTHPEELLQLIEQWYT